MNKNKKTTFGQTMFSVFKFIILFLVLCLFLFLLYILWDKLSFILDSEKLREYIESFGMWGPVVFIAIFLFQILVAIIPGEPIEIAAGYVFGIGKGILLSEIAVLLGTAIIYCLVRFIGKKSMVVYMFSKKRVEKIEFLQNEKKLEILTFLLFLLPGTPKDLLTYFIPLTKMKPSVFFVISTVGRLPSIITSVAGGRAIGNGNYVFAVLLFLITGLLGIIGLIIYNRISKK